MDSSSLPANIIHETDPLITKAINDFTLGKEGFETKTTAQALSKIAEGDMKLLDLIENLWEQINRNWSDAGQEARSAETWRWGFEKHINPENDSREKRLEKALSILLPDDWANQVPTASGLVSSTSDRLRNIDLAHAEREAVTMIELKIASDTPVYAAFEIVRNGLLLCLARNNAGKIHIADQRWRDAKTVNLRVLAPPSYYAPYKLGWFEQEIDRAVTAFRPTKGLAMNFRFRQFASEQPFAEMLRECLEHGKVFEL